MIGKRIVAEKIALKIKQRIAKLLAAKKPYVELPPTDPHQEEVDENALNEALEARLMELIASSPALEKPITLQFGSTEILATPAQDPSQLLSSQIQTSCQTAQCQVPAC